MVVIQNFFRRLVLGFVAILIFTGLDASATILFEGYSKVMLSGQHVGFVVQRYEFDAKKKEFKMISYLKTSPAGGNVTESYVCRSTTKLKPISFQYTSLVNDTAKLLDGTFKKDVMTLVTKEKGTATTVKKQIPKGMFLSSFLGYLMLQGKEGIKPGVRYSYQAVAEEDGNGYNGEANITAQENVKGIATYKVLNTYKGEQFISNVTSKGEIITTLSPVKQIGTELVADIKEATSAPGLSVNTSNLSLLFGNVPKGAENAVARKASSAPAVTADKPGTKTGATAAENSATPLTPDLDEAPAASEPATKSPAKKPAPTKSKQQTLDGESADGSEPKKAGIPGGKGIMIKMTPTPDYEGK